MESRPLRVGDVVQIDPTKLDCLFAGAFMVVTEPRSWGAQGFIACDFTRGEMPKRAYYRAGWKDMEYVGRASWVLSSEMVD